MLQYSIKNGSLEPKQASSKPHFPIRQNTFSKCVEWIFLSFSVRFFFLFWTKICQKQSLPKWLNIVKDLFHRRILFFHFDFLWYFWARLKTFISNITFWGFKWYNWLIDFDTPDVSDLKENLEAKSSGNLNILNQDHSLSYLRWKVK